MTTARTVAANGQAAFAIGELDLLFPSGDFGDAGYAAFLALALDGTNVVLGGPDDQFNRGGQRVGLLAAGRDQLDPFYRGRSVGRRGNSNTRATRLHHAG